MNFSNRFLSLSLLAICWVTPSLVTAQTAPQSDPAGLVTDGEQSMFIKGQSLYSQGLHSEAINVLNQFLERYPHSLIYDLGLLWLGRSYLAQADLAAAENVGLRLRALPDSSMVGIYEEELRLGRQNYVRAALGSTGVTNGKSTVASAPEITKPVGVEKIASEPAVQKTAQPAIQPVALQTGTKPENEPDKKILGSGLFLPSAVELPVERAKVSLPRDDARPRTNALQVAAAAPPRTAPVSSPAMARSHAVTPTQTVNSLSSPIPQVVKNSKPSTPAQAVQSPSGAPFLRATTAKLPLAAGQTSYRLTILNEGGGAAKDLTVRLEVDGPLDVVATEPVLHRQELIARKQIFTFRLPLIESGQSEVIQITVRSPNASPIDLNAQIRHAIFYRDSKGQLLHTP